MHKKVKRNEQSGVQYLARPPVFSPQEEIYIQKVILDGMREAARNGTDDVFPYFVDMHKKITAPHDDQYGRTQEAIQLDGIDTFDLVIRGMDAVKQNEIWGFDFCEEIEMHGASYFYERIRGEKERDLRLAENAKVDAEVQRKYNAYVKGLAEEEKRMRQ
jgi:hypothetical protein